MSQKKVNRLDSLAVSRKSLREDGWSNIYTGRGVLGRDKQLGTTYGRVALLSEEMLRNLYRGDGFAKRVINLPTSEMVREWFDINGDTDGSVTKYLADLKTKKFMLKALRWARLYGGAVMIMGINDGGDLEDPLDEKRMDAVEFFRVHDRWRVTWTSADLYDDPSHVKYGTPERYTISPIMSGGAGSFRVHETRVLVFDGVDCDDKTRQENHGWGDSYLQAVWNELSNLSGAYHSAKEVIDDFIQIILKIKNLQEMIAAGQDDLVKKRLEILDMGRHVMNTMMLDADENYSKESSQIGGMDHLLQEFQKAVSAVTEIPMTLLMGQSPAGLSATGESDITQWYDRISREQEDELLPHLQRLVHIVMLCRNGPTRGKELKDWSINFRPLWQSTEKEIVDVRRTQAETDKIYIQEGVLLPSEVANSRFGGEEYSIDTSIEDGLHEIGVEIEPEPEPEPEPESEPDDVKDEVMSVKRKGNSSYENNHQHPYTLNDKGNGQLQSGTFPLWSGSKETFTITHTHEVIAYNVQSGGLDGHTHELEYSLGM